MIGGFIGKPIGAPTFEATEAIASAAGVGAATAPGRAVIAAISAAAGVGAASAGGAKIGAAQGTAAGIGSASGSSSASAIVSGAGTAQGIGSASAQGRAIATATISSAAGIGSAQGGGSTGSAAVSGAGTAQGVGGASAGAVSFAAVAGTAQGIGGASGGGAKFGTAAGTAQGIGSASATGRGIVFAAGAAAGVGSASASSAQIAAASGTASGVGSAHATGDTFTLTYLWPDGDVAADGWTDQTAGTVNIYQALDEVSASDADFVQSPQVVGSTADLTVRLYQGAVLIAEWPHIGIADAYVDATQTLTAPQYAAITDFSNLFVEFDDGLGNVYRFGLSNPPSDVAQPVKIKYRFGKLAA